MIGDIGRAGPAPDINEEKRLQAKRAGVDADGGELASALEHARDSFIQYFEDYAFGRALETIWTVIARADKMISDAKPWELAKDETQRQTLNAVLYRAAETLRWLAVLLHPAMPEATRAIWRQLGQAGDIAKYDPAELQWGGLQAGGRIGEVAPVFPRIDKAKIMAEIEKENEAKNAQAETRRRQTGTHATKPSRQDQPNAPTRNPNAATRCDRSEGRSATQAGTTRPKASTLHRHEDFAKSNCASAR